MNRLGPLLLLFLSLHSALSMPSGKEHETVELCYGEIGCIVIDDSWYDSGHRPFNLEPLPRERINTRFILKTRELPNRDTMIYASDLDSIRNSHFNPSRPTVFICHGFIDDGNVSWIRRLTAALLDYQDCNVIAVNWGGGSLPLYTQATANTRVVGLEIAHLVNTLIANFGVQAENVHLIGHSLGAHTVGYAGERIPNLGRITGLDPAEPYFQYMPEHVRLDPSDAKFVDVIHTDTRTILLLGYGMLQPCGHLDFYVNGGRQQPGCDLVNIGLDAITEDMVTGVRELAACNHLRACEFMIDSLRPDADMVAYECLDNDIFELGECYTCGEDNSKCAKFGMEAALYPLKNRTFVSLYFDTGKDKPYTKYHYQVRLTLAKPSNAENEVYGHVKLSLFGTKGQILNAPVNDEPIFFNHGFEHRMLFKDDVNVGKIQRVELHWKYDTGIFHPCGLFCNDHMYVASVEVSELNNYPESNRLEHTYKSCPLNSAHADINSGSTAEFYPTAC